MREIFSFVFESFCKPFKSRLFRLVFPFFFLPVSLFGVYYKWFNDNSLSFFSYFTPESLFTFTIPLMASVIMDGVIAASDKLSEEEKGSAKHEILRDSLVCAVIVLVLQCAIIYNSISKDNIFLSVFSVLILLFFWVIVSSTKKEYRPSQSWKSTGKVDTSSKDSIPNS